MECYYHPSRESTDKCAICGKSICKECGLELAGNVYCKECLEKIVGTGLSQKQSEPQEPEPVMVEEEVIVEEEDAFDMSSLTKAQPEEVQFSNQRIADDSPYNIKDSIQYEGGPQSRHHGERVVPEQPVNDVRREFIQEEPVQQARNEYDYAQTQPQTPQSEEFIYPDHSYEPPETSARLELEDKYEKYLDDLYFDEEPEIPLNEQLARDEAEYGSLTKREYPPRRAPEPPVEEVLRETHVEEIRREAPVEPRPQSVDEAEIERRIREELARREQAQGYDRREPLHNIDYKEEKEPYGVLDIILTIILIIVILIVLFYILYVFKLSATYPTFIDAVFGLKNPGQFISALMH